MNWEIIDTGPNFAQQNMILDSQFLENLAHQQKPILHLYDWDGPSATYGHFIDPKAVLRQEAVSSFGLQLARRPTGGGLIFHITDFAFSILIPASHPKCSVNTLENYAFINSIIMESLKMFTDCSPSLLPSEPHVANPAFAKFCMAKPTKYDVILNEKKAGGGAQRRTKHGFLHQGTISLAMPEESFLRQILPSEDIYDAMCANTHFLIPHHTSRQQIAVVRKQLAEILVKTVNETQTAN